MNSEVILVNINELVQCKSQLPDSSGQRPVLAGNSTKIHISNRKRSHEQCDFDAVANTSKFWDQPYNFALSEKLRRSSASNTNLNSNWISSEVAPPLDSNYTPCGKGENEKEVLVVSPIDEEESQEASLIKTEGFPSAIAVVHYPTFPEVNSPDQGHNKSAGNKGQCEVKRF